MPDPRNFVPPELLGFRQIISGRASKPIEQHADSNSALFGYRRNWPPIVRVASPILTQSMPPGTSKRKTCFQVLVSSLCISVYAPWPSLAERHFLISGFILQNTSSHIEIIGYGGEVTTRWTESDGKSERSLPSLYRILWRVSAYDWFPILTTTPAMVAARFSSQPCAHPLLPVFRFKHLLIGKEHR